MPLSGLVWMCVSVMSPDRSTNHNKRKFLLMNHWPTPVAAQCDTRGLQAVCLLGLRVRIPPKAWMFCVLRVLAGCDGLFTPADCGASLSVIVEPR